MTTELIPAEGITVTTYRGEADDVPVVQIDTTEAAGWLRVDIASFTHASLVSRASVAAIESVL